MAELKFNDLVVRYERAYLLFQQGRGYLKGLAANAERFLHHEAHGSIKSSFEDGAVILEFLDRRIRVVVRLASPAGRCVLVVEDLSVANLSRPPQEIARIPFNATGETEFGGGHNGGKVSLAVDQDHVTIMMHIVDVALKHDPWAPGA